MGYIYPSMRVALLSDAHLMGPDDPNQRLILTFLERLEVDELCILGDFFQAWWHYGAEPFPEYRPLVDALRRFKLSFTPGNHDFHAPGFLERELGATVGRTLTPRWDGLRVHLSHGDSADRSFQYALACAALRGRPFAAWMDLLGPERGWRFLNRLAGRPHGGPDPVLITEQLRQARALLGSHDLVVMGHTHAPGLYRSQAGTFVNLGDWVMHHSWLMVDNGVPQMFSHRDGRDLAVPEVRPL